MKFSNVLEITKGINELLNFWPKPNAGRPFSTKKMYE